MSSALSKLRLLRTSARATLRRKPAFHRGCPVIARGPGILGRDCPGVAGRHLLLELLAFVLLAVAVIVVLQLFANPLVIILLVSVTVMMRRHGRRAAR